MTLLVDWQIRDLVQSEDMISPFVEGLVEKGVISYGLGTAGYDVRVGNKGKIYTNVNSTVVDPKRMTSAHFIEVEVEEYFIIPPNSYMLAATVEYFKMPRQVLGLISNKSTYARAGVVCPSCVAEPGWHGHLTLEIANQTPLPAKVYANEGITQLLFYVTAAPKTAYDDRAGKYQGQTGITLPKVREG